MTFTELTSVMNAIAERHGTQTHNTQLHIDAMDSPDANYLVCEVWTSGDVDIYVTDDDDKFINEHCYDDNGDVFSGLKSVTIWRTINGIAHGSALF